MSFSFKEGPHISQETRASYSECAEKSRFPWTADFSDLLDTQYTFLHPAHALDRRALLPS